MRRRHNDWQKLRSVQALQCTPVGTVCQCLCFAVCTGCVLMQAQNDARKNGPPASTQLPPHSLKFARSTVIFVALAQYSAAFPAPNHRTPLKVAPAPPTSTMLCAGPAPSRPTFAQPPGDNAQLSPENASVKLVKLTPTPTFKTD